MILEKIKDIEIIYDESKKDIVKDFREVLKHNYDLFIMNLDGYKEGLRKISFVYKKEYEESDDILYIDDYKFYIDTVMSYYSNERLINNFERVDLSRLYLEYLNRQNNISENNYVGTYHVRLNDEEFYDYFEDVIGYHYYKENGTKDDFMNYVKYRKNYDAIIDFVINKTRYNLVNYLLDYYTRVFSYDEIFIKNIPNINKLLKKELSFYLSSLSKKATSKEVENISKEEFDKLFYEFLKYINAPKEWEKAYNYLKQNNLIIFEDKKGESNNSCCFMEDGKLKILVSDDQTLNTFISFVHEFIHYISYFKNSDLSKLALQEFPSIFFEKIAAKFLVNKGYNEEYINYITYRRVRWNVLTSMPLSKIFDELSSYITNGEVVREEKINEHLEKARKVMEWRENNPISKAILHAFKADNITLDKEKAKLITDTYYDDLILQITKYGFLIINGFQYIIGTHLRDKILDSMNLDDVIPMMIVVSCNLKNYEIEGIQKLFNINIFDDEKEQEKENELSNETSKKYRK